MSRTQMVTTVNQKFEMAVLPVSDVDRAKSFYQGLGWRMDGDFNDGKDWRVVQMTPPGSPCSVIFCKEIMPAGARLRSAPLSSLFLDNIEAARAELPRSAVASA